MNQAVTKREKYFFYFVLVDIIFAPYFPWLAITFSQLFVFGWFMLEGYKQAPPREVTAYRWLLILVAASTALSPLWLPPGQEGFYFFDNIKRALNFGISISYYFYFLHYLRRIELKMWKWVFAMIVYIGLWAYIFYMDSSLFFRLKTLFNPRDSLMLMMDEHTGVFRFNFIWTDPNNVGYALVGLLAYLLIDIRTPKVVIAIAVLLAAFSTILIMSAGTLISAAIVLPLALLVRFRRNHEARSVLMTIVLAFLVIQIGSRYSRALFGSDLGTAAIERLQQKEEVGDDRPTIWKNLVLAKNPLTHMVLGEGENLFVEEELYFPHSGHLMLFYGYGMIVYVLYMFLIFRKVPGVSWADYLPVMAFLLCFTINVGIGEMKFCGIMSLLVAYQRLLPTQQKPQPVLAS